MTTLCKKLILWTFFLFLTFYCFPKGYCVEFFVSSFYLIREIYRLQAKMICFTQYGIKLLFWNVTGV